MKVCSFLTCLLYTVHVSACIEFPFYSYGHIVVIQSVYRRRPNDILAFDILFCGSASMSPSLAITLPKYTNYFTGFSVGSSALMSSSMVVVELSWNITSVFFMLIMREKTLMMHWQTHQQSSGSHLLSGQLVGGRLQKAVILQVYLWFLSSL